MRTEVPFGGGQLKLKLAYPADYPNSPPSVFGLNRPVFERHQDPTNGVLCILAQPERDWTPERSGAWLVQRGQQTLFAATEAGGDAVREGELAIPEPYSAYVPARGGQSFIVPDPFWGDVGTRGGAAKFSAGDSKVLLIHADGIGSVAQGLQAKFMGKQAKEFEGGWISLANPEVILQGMEAFEDSILDAVRSTVLDEFPELATGKDLANHSKKVRREATIPVAVTFIEEGGTRDEERRAWIRCSVRMRALGQLSIVENSLERAQAFSAEHRGVRVPDLAGADGLRVVVIGAGSVGSPIILELAKAGVGRIDVVDDDYVDTNNSVRHIAPVSTAGEPKAEVVSEAARQLNPFVEVRALSYDAVSTDEHLQTTRDLAGAANLVVDTTGLAHVSRTISKICRSEEVALIVTGLTNGAVGGDIFWVEPEGPCFECFLRDQQENADHRPPAGDEPLITPTGCRHPTFTGTGFDATEFAMNAVRLAFQKLEPVRLGGPEGNLAIVRFREDPRFEIVSIGSHPECSVCGMDRE